MTSSTHSHKNGPIRIDFAAKLSPAEIKNLVQEINDIYLEEEGAIWPDDGTYERINAPEVEKLIEQEELILGWCGGFISSTIRLYQKEGRWYFGLLTTNRQYRGKGMASQLMTFVEAHLKSIGIHELYIEIIFSKGVDMPRKESLKVWYLSKGFETDDLIEFSQVDPEKSKLLKHPAYFEVLKKIL